MLSYFWKNWGSAKPSPAKYDLMAPEAKSVHSSISLQFCGIAPLRTGPDRKNNPNTSTSASARCKNIVRVQRCTVWSPPGAQTGDVIGRISGKGGEAEQWGRVVSHCKDPRKWVAVGETYILNINRTFSWNQRWKQYSEATASGLCVFAYSDRVQCVVLVTEPERCRWSLRITCVSSPSSSCRHHDGPNRRCQTSPLKSCCTCSAKEGCFQDIRGIKRHLCQPSQPETLRSAASFQTCFFFSLGHIWTRVL